MISSAPLRNTSRPVSRLPSELLCEVFKYCATEDSRDEFRLTLTQICQHWRTVACNTTSLWTYPQLSSPEVAKEMLSRSGGAPLHICYYQNFRTLYEPISRKDHGKREALLIALDHLPRIKTLSLNMPEVDLLEAASRIRAAPSLLQLSIFSQNCDLPRNFLSDGAPLLSEAILDSCGLACDSPLLHSLTSLELLGGVDRSVMEARLPDALRNMPLLETLAVDQVYCDAPAEPIVVPLPKLRRLQLQATHPLAITIFDYITFPASTFVMIEIYGQSFPADTPFEDFGTFWRGIARILSPEFHSDSQRIVKTLAVDGDNGYRGLSFTLRAWHDNLPFDSILDQSPLSSPDLTINVGWSNHHRTPDNFGDPEFFEMVFLAAFGALHLPALETLHLGAFPKSIGIEIQVILMPHLWTCPLRTLILHVERCALYLPELLVLQQDNSSLSVPSLETLVFTHCNWDHELARELLSSLRARAMRGSKLQKIVMRACTNNVEVDLRSFQDVAKEVDWDSANTESIRYARH